MQGNFNKMALVTFWGVGAGGPNICNKLATNYSANGTHLDDSFWGFSRTFFLHHPSLPSLNFWEERVQIWKCPDPRKNKTVVKTGGKWENIPNKQLSEEDIDKNSALKQILYWFSPTRQSAWLVWRSKMQPGQNVDESSGNFQTPFRGFTFSL